MTSKELKSERIRRRLLAKFRFRALVRKVIVNNAWLKELEDTKLGDNVRRNVAIILRGKGKKGILTIQEKALLNIPIEERTQIVKKKLIAIMTGLECLRRYPPKVRAKLASATYYLYYNSGRTIVRENNVASALYFVLSGEVIVYQRHFIHSEQLYKDIPIASKGPGDVFGEVALLLDIKRTATCITSKDTELLCIYKKDFEAILKQTLLSQWDEINEALSRFEFFSMWTTGQKRECCMLASIKQYNPHSLIYSEDKDLLTPVHFVLSGSCQILQCLKMKKKTINGVSSYQLVDIVAVKHSGTQDILDKIKNATKNSSIKAENVAGTTSNDYLDLHETAEKDQKETIKEANEQNTSIKWNDLTTMDIKHVFVNTGSYSCGSVFGLGEQMEHRTIVAKDIVQCLVIPRYWLLQRSQNSGNIWLRSIMYLDTLIPSRQKLFDDYLATTQWNDYRKSLINNIVTVQTQNETRINDIPRICRIEKGDQ